MCIRQAFQAVHAAICCLIFMAIIGPILIIVGIVILTTPNHRASNIKSYNNAVNQWPPLQSAVSRWSGVAYQTPQSITQAVVLRSTAANVMAVGNTDGVQSANSTYLSGGLSSNFSLSGTGVTYVMNWGTFSRSFPFSLSQTASISCSSSSCDSYCSDSSNRRCTSTLLAARCTSLYGSSATYSGDSVCYGTDRCGTCSYIAYPSRLCAVADIDPTSLVAVASTTMSSCYYPFDVDSNPYTETSLVGGVTLEIRSSADPFVVMQQLTQGSMDFGLTAGQQAGNGLGCLAVGIIITIVVCGGTFWFCRHRNQQQQQQQQLAAYPPQQGIPMHNQPPPVGYPQQAPYYGQSYGQPQPAYQQAPVAYGQPQPAQAGGYGPPPPGYPAPAYGQPPPEHVYGAKQV